MKKFYIHEADNGYIFDKRIFWGVIAVGLLIFGFLAWQNDFDFSYNWQFECKGLSCENPMISDVSEVYNPYTKYDYKADCVQQWCITDRLSSGTYGKRPPMLYTIFSPLMIALVILGVILNHVIHNQGKTPSVRLNLPEKWNQAIKRVLKKMAEESDKNEKDDNKGFD